VKTRESVALTVKEAAASIAGMEVIAGILDQGLFKREYRDHRLEWMVRSGGIDVVLKGIEKQNIRFTEFE
jgi:glutathione S-transferase/RNA polymerase-associated protein